MNASVKVCIIIPSLEPNDKLILLLEDLRFQFRKQENMWIDAAIIVVDDGSGQEYDYIFQQAESKYGCILLRHAVNLGKGRALKSAFNYFLNKCLGFNGVITADSDGQHSADDIIRCINELSGENSLILGCRDFESENIPLKSLIGNKLTKNIFRFFCGISVSDTQTGLRAIPSSLLKTMLTVPGERFEYEMNMLVECGNSNINIKEVPIKTIYSESNKGTHFNPLFDSVRIYKVFLKYSFSSIGASCIDFLIFYLFTSSHSNLAVATAISRLGGVAFNFIVNRNVVFKSNSNILISAIKYLLLAIVSGTVSYYILVFMHRYFYLLVSKVIAETSMFLVNYYFQKNKIFNKS